MPETESTQRPAEILFEFDTFALHIEWDRPSSDTPALPRLVGPFPNREAADEWATLNIPNGAWEAWPLAWPHYVSPTAAFNRGLLAATHAVAGLCVPTTTEAQR